MGKNKMKVALIGPYPPPYGGISIYIQRLKKRLEEKEINCLVYDTSGIDKEYKNMINIRKVRKRLLKSLFVGRENIVHLQCSQYSSKLLFKTVLLALFNKKGVITYHNWRKEIKSINLLEKILVKLASVFIPCFIAVGPHIKKNLINLGFNPKKIEIIPAYITPLVEEEDINAIPEGVWNFIDSHNPIISANAFRIDFFNNQDRYGIDMCIDLCANLKNAYPKIGFVFCLPDIGDYEYFQKMKQKIVERGIGNNFLFQTKPCQLYPILMKSDVFVRPANLDAYGVSIAEAIYFKVPALASDVCLRPEGTILFKSRDSDDFASKVKHVLNNYKEYKGKIANIEFEDNVKKIVKIYKTLENK